MVLRYIMYDMYNIEGISRENISIKEKSILLRKTSCSSFYANPNFMCDPIWWHTNPHTYTVYKKPWT